MNAIYKRTFWTLGGWFTWVAVGVTAVSAIGSAVAANNTKAPKTAEYKPVDLQEEQRKALAGNMENMPEIEALTSRSNTFAQGQASSLMEQALPGWGNLQKKLTSTTDSLLTNPYDLPEDVQNNLERLAAERGISAGTRGQFNDFSLMRDFGINSLQYGQSRINQASGLTQLLASTAPRVNPISPLSFMVTPQAQAEETRNNNTQKQAIDQGAYNAEAAANNAKWAAYSSALSSMAGSFSGAWAMQGTSASTPESKHAAAQTAGRNSGYQDILKYNTGPNPYG
jgi:hypothetical protein